MANRTTLYPLHLEFGGRMVEFAGWDLPLHFGSQLEEHRTVRRRVGMFDVSHMSILDLGGAKTEEFLARFLSNDIARLRNVGRAQYTCLLNPRGGIIDDAIVYRRSGGSFRLVSNAATRDRVLAWVMERTAAYDVSVEPRRELAIIAVQGPEAREKAAPFLPAELRESAGTLEGFGFAEGGGWFVGCTGYTGEDGYEIILPGTEAPTLWRRLAEAGVAPCGLGARDTLRLEAGLCLSGQDMDETVTPLECGLGWTCAWEPEEREFIGRAALEEQKRAGGLRRFVGLVLEGPGVLRHGQAVLVPEIGEGVVTSGIFSPTLGCSIAFARLPPGDYQRCLVDIRGRLKPARVRGVRFLREHRKRGYE